MIAVRLQHLTLAAVIGMLTAGCERDLQELRTEVRSRLSERIRQEMHSLSDGPPAPTVESERIYTEIEILDRCRERVLADVSRRFSSIESDEVAVPETNALLRDTGAARCLEPLRDDSPLLHAFDDLQRVRAEYSSALRAYERAWSQHRRAVERGTRHTHDPLEATHGQFLVMDGALAAAIEDKAIMLEQLRLDAIAGMESRALEHDTRAVILTARRLDACLRHFSAPLPTCENHIAGAERALAALAHRLERAPPPQIFWWGPFSSSVARYREQLERLVPRKGSPSPLAIARMHERFESLRRDARTLEFRDVSG